jgi:pSer/pThr/pTyr-binding forkhead associated (FHA) protein
MGTTTDSMVTPSVSSPVEPALVVAFGATTNKRRPLTKPSTLIGRNRCCDIRVESPEISGLHCLISRHAEGLTLRDCDSKSGVIVNGQVCREAELRDGDQIQIGPFSFVVSLPSAGLSVAADRSSVEQPRIEEELEKRIEQEKNLQRHIASVEAERDRLATQAQELRAELNRSSNKIHELDAAYSQIDRLKSELVDRERLSSELGQTLCSLDAFRKSAEDRHGRLASELEELRATVVDRESIVSLPDERDSQLIELRGQIDRWEDESQQLRDRIVELTEEKLAWQKEAGDWRRAAEEAPAAPSVDASELEQLRADVEQLRVEARERGQEAEQLRTRIAELTQEQQAWQAQVEELQAAAATREAERESADGSADAEAGVAQDSAVIAELVELRLRLEQIEKEKESLATLAKDHQSRADWLEEELQSYSNEQNRSKAEIESLRYAAEVATKETQGLRAQTHQMESELANLRTEHITLTQTQAFTLGGSKEKLAAMEAELTRVRDELESRERQLLASQQEKSKLKAELESGGASMIGELAQSRAMIADLERELIQARSVGSAAGEAAEEIETLRRQIASLERESADQRAENHRLARQLEELANPLNRSAEEAAVGAAHSDDAGEAERWRSEWEAAEESRQELARRLEAEHEQSEQRLLAMRQQLEAERTQMKQLVMQAAADHDRTRAEMESLRSQLSTPAGEQTWNGEAVESVGTPEEWRYLQERVQELESALSSGEPTAMREEGELDQYEQQLEQYRADLEQAQLELSQREQELETERLNLQDKLRQAELDLSRERASFAREKAELDRMKREFVAEIEHVERESTARARLAPLDKLANEVKGRVRETPAAPAQPSLSDRLRNFMRRTSEGGNKPEGSA